MRIRFQENFIRGDLFIVSAVDLPVDCISVKTPPLICSQEKQIQSINEYRSQARQYRYLNF